MPEQPPDVVDWMGVGRAFDLQVVEDTGGLPQAVKRHQRHDDRPDRNSRCAAPAASRASIRSLSEPPTTSARCREASRKCSTPR